MTTPARDPDPLPPVLLVPGLGDSGPDHWQTLWGAEDASFARVVQPDWDTPKLDAWAATVARAIDRCGAPPVLVAHGYGCLAALRAAHLLERRVAGALLVAPADPDRFEAAAKLPSRPLPCAAVLVASNNDPTLKMLTAGMLAIRWGCRFVPLQDAGHINAESGHGPWPEGLRLLTALRHRTTTRTPAPLRA